LISIQFIHSVNLVNNIVEPYYKYPGATRPFTSKTLTYTSYVFPLDAFIKNLKFINPNPDG